MEIIVAGLAVLTVAVITVPLLAVRAGIRRQQQAGSLVSRVPGRSAGLARRVTGLYAETPPFASRPVAVVREISPAPIAKGTRAS
jgi:hypothetical protein